MPLNGRAPAHSPRKWLENADGFLGAWHEVVYAETEAEFNGLWKRLRSEFSAQGSKSSLYSLPSYTCRRRRASPACHLAVELILPRLFCALCGGYPGGYPPHNPLDVDHH